MTVYAEKSVRDKINVGHYETTIPYPIKPGRPRSSGIETAEEAQVFADLMKLWAKAIEVWQKAIKIYREDGMKKDLEFRMDALKENGLEGHPKAEAAFQMAWDRCHSGGRTEVLLELGELADLLL